MEEIKAVVRMIVGIILGALGGWLIGVFFHCSWWSFKGMIGDPFDITSGLVLYTVPYAVIGAIVGASALAEE